MKRTNKFLSVILSILMIMSIVPLTARAAEPTSGTCGENIIWEFDDEAGILIISGTGDMYNYTGYYTPWENFKDKVKEVNIAYGVTKIGNCAFFSYTNLENVSIPNSVTTIGTSAFNCCSNLTNIVIPDSVTSINDGAFYCCSSLTSVSIPSSVKTIGNSAFYSCSNLANITIPDNVTLVGIYAFEYTAFYNNEANWESDVLYIGNHLFAANSTVSGEYVIKNGTKTIADSAFSGCTSLTGVSFPNSLVTIGERAFLGCYNLNDIIIPDSVTLIGDEAFNACKKMTSITVDSNNQNYTSVDGVLYNKDKTVLIKYPEGDNTKTEYIIPDTVLTVKAWAFRNCSTLDKITIPNSVITIGDNAFYYCLSLTDIVIGKNVATIGECAFDECSNLKTVYYTGTSAQWNKISIDDSNTYLLNAIIHYDSNASDFAYSVISETDKTIMITGYNVSGPVKEIVIPSTIDGYTVIAIDEYVFKDIDTLTDLQLPNTLKTIGKYAFSDCDSLKNVIIPNSVTTIGLRAFYSCSALETVTFGINLESIGNKAFYQCKKMTDVYYTGTEAQWNEISIGTDNLAINDATKHFEFKHEDEPDEFITGTCGDNLTWALNLNTGALTISGTGAMYDYEYDNGPWNNYRNVIKNVVISDGATTIGNYVFQGCENLTSVSIPEGITSIGNSAFTASENLTSVTLPNSLTTIGIYSFAWCSNLESIVIPENVTEIGEQAFYNCESLKTISIPYRVTSIKNKTFSGCTKLESVVIADSVETIDDYAFYGCSLLKDVTFGNSIKTIGYESFYLCSNLTNAVLPDSLTTIEDSAFKYCVQMAFVKFGENISTIGYAAFNQCSGLTVVYYAGSEEQWNTISIGDYNTRLTNAKFHYDNCEGVYKATIIAPTCMAQGYTAHTCDCGDTYHDTYVDVDSTGHNYIAEITAPTCIERGYTTYTCECGDTYVDDYVDVNGHTEEILPAVVPTCTETGLTAGVKCSECGEIITEQQEIPALGHISSNAVEENYNAHTCTENGSKDVVIYCSVCEEEISRETITLNATGHEDNDGDGYCDMDNELLDPSVECDHSCHKEGITAFFWRIINVFNMFLGLNKICSCGVAHY